MVSTIDGGGIPQINAHFCDGQLYKYNIIPRANMEEKQMIISSLINLIQERASPNIRDFGVRGLSIILQDIEKMENYSLADKISVDDILVEICYLLVEEKDIEVVDTAIAHLCEQMADMINTSGYCPQGRCNRCFMIYMFLKDRKDGVHLTGKHTH